MATGGPRWATLEQVTSSLSLGRIFGIPIGVNWSIIAVAVLFTMALSLQALPRSVPGTPVEIRVVVAAVAVLVFFASILAHELGHAVVALEHGVGVDGITLWLLGGVAKLDRQAPTARAEWQIAVAGPAVSLLLGVFFGAVTVIAYAVGVPLVVVAIGSWLAGVNVILAVFNLLPAAPLDGGRVLSAILWHRLGEADRARVIAGRCGIVLSVILVAGGIAQMVLLDQLGGWVTALVGLFTFGAARAEIAAAAIRRRLSTTLVGDFLAPHPPSVPDSFSVKRFVEGTAPGRSSTAHAVTRWDTAPIGYAVPASAIQQLSEPERTWTTVGQVMYRNDLVGWIAADRPVRELIEFWERYPVPLAVVTDPGSGRPLGTVTQIQVRPLLLRPDLWGRDRPAPTPVRPPAGGAIG